MAVYLEPHVLDKAWIKFADEHGRHWERSYQYKYRNGSNGSLTTLFEDWLFEKGAVIEQKNKQRRIKFYDELDAALFAMEYID